MSENEVFCSLSLHLFFVFGVRRRLRQQQYGNFAFVSGKLQENSVHNGPAVTGGGATAAAAAQKWKPDFFFIGFIFPSFCLGQKGAKANKIKVYLSFEMVWNGAFCTYIQHTHKQIYTVHLCYRLANKYIYMLRYVYAAAHVSGGKRQTSKREILSVLSSPSSSSSPLLSSMVMVCSGYLFSLILLRDSDIYFWGWLEFNIAQIIFVLFDAYKYKFRQFFFSFVCLFVCFGCSRRTFLFSFLVVDGHRKRKDGVF